MRPHFRFSVVSVIVGARNEDQLRQNLGAVGWNLTREQVAKLDASEVPSAYRIGIRSISPIGTLRRFKSQRPHGSHSGCRPTIAPSALIPLASGKSAS